ncbi:MAG: DNA (cytosine-5-)-methyltransferase [Methylovulum sp.]|nr:DNA (cytosine-5-)-methyltransferase [Methylovulum sp.]
MKQQMNLFELDETMPPPENWFQNAMDFFNLEEMPGWPDNFGTAFHNWCTSQNIAKIKTLSLFSGGGGLDIAFHDMGFDIFECVEIESKFADSLLLNSAKGKRFYGCNILCKDIRDYTPVEQDIDFIIGGPPCQTFSAAGARASGVNGIDDKRGTLFQEYVRILKQIRPKAFLFENVYRIVGAQGGEPWALIQEAFKSAGYKLYWRILDTADYGVPQHRERLIIVGVRDDCEFLFPSPTHGPDSIDNRPYYKAGKAVHGIDGSNCIIGINGRHGYLLNDIPPGLNYSFYTEKMGHPKPIFGWRSKFSDYLYKADPNTPIRTLKAQGGQYTGPFSWENRPFMLGELKRLQTFPDDYDISGNRQTAIHQIGNSVPPQMGRIMALAILNQIFEVTLPFKIQYLRQNEQLGFRARKSSLTAIYKKKATQSINIKFSNTKAVTYEKESGRCDLKLTDQFQLVEDSLNKSTPFSFKFSIDYDKWIIECANQQINEEIFSVLIKLSPTQRETINTGEIQLISYDKRPVSILALWKFLEMKLNTLIYKDDLVQLFGYYQYKQLFYFDFKLTKKDVEPGFFWKVVSCVTRGECVGKTLNISDIAEIYNVDTTHLIEALKILKTIGFEIRSSNTNQQIKENYYLIPYQFPTLNERSLQRLTAL